MVIPSTLFHTRQAFSFALFCLTPTIRRRLPFKQTSGFVLMTLCLLPMAPSARAQITERVSVGIRPARGNSASYAPSFSADGRYIAFTSQASNFVPGDTNNQADVFVYDRTTRETSRVSVSSAGAQGDADSGYQSGFFGGEGPHSLKISANGRYVVFGSRASNLVPEDTNGKWDVFVYDRSTRQTTRISVGSAGVQGDGDSGVYGVDISAEGQYVVFASVASNLVNGDPTSAPDVFLHDRSTGQTTRVSGSSGGGYLQASLHYSSGLSISDNGQYIAYLSTSGQVFVYDRTSGQTTQVSVNSAGTGSSSLCSSAEISAEGRYVAFTSDAPNLAANDTNGRWDVFVHDRQTQQTERVSVSSSGEQGNNDSGFGSFFFPNSKLELSADGRYVAFHSRASNLAPESTNGVQQVFVRDRIAGQTTIVSLTSTEQPGNSSSYAPTLSADGHYVAFSSEAPNLGYGIVVRDRTAGQMSLISGLIESDGNSYAPAISGDGRYVVFRSLATNLIEGTGTGGLFSQVFVYDRIRRQTTLVSASNNGEPGNSHSGESWLNISSDGRYVVFDSQATDLVTGDTNGVSDVFVYDRQTRHTKRISVSSSGEQGNDLSYGSGISADGRYVAFVSSASNLVPGDTNGVFDVFIHDCLTEQTTRVSVSSTGEQGNSEGGYAVKMTVEGRYILFGSTASNLVAGDTNGKIDTFVHDCLTGQTTRVSVNSMGEQGNDDSSYYGSGLSADGRYVAFASAASNLVNGDTNAAPDVFVHDRDTGQTTCVSVSSLGELGNSNSGDSGLSLSADGRYVAFSSVATNLATADTDSSPDVFVYDRVTGETILVSVHSSGEKGNSWSGFFGLDFSEDGKYVVFHSTASNLVTEDSNAYSDIFVRGPLFTGNSISGILTLEDLVPSATPQEITFTFRDTNGTTLFPRSASVAPNGFFILDGVAPGDYILHIKGAKYLARNVEVQATEPVSGVTATLKAADANDDNSVDVLDLDVLIRAFDNVAGDPNWNANADFNGDASVDVLDLDILIRNFDAQGDS
jgi:hypothetical protein